MDNLEFTLREYLATPESERIYSPVFQSKVPINNKGATKYLFQSRENGYIDVVPIPRCIDDLSPISLLLWQHEEDKATD